jgi:hypothetical protein
VQFDLAGLADNFVSFGGRELLLLGGGFSFSSHTQNLGDLDVEDENNVP